MEIIESHNYGYLSMCKHCGKTFEYDSRDTTGIIKFIIIAKVVGFLLYIALIFFGVID